MNLLDQILEYNQEFVKEKKFKEFTSTKYPEKRLVILSCMDTRLVELLPKSMNMRNGDVKIVKNAGAVIMHPFGSIMRSLLVAVHELNADEVMVIGHSDCGMGLVKPKEMIAKMKSRGISQEKIDILNYSGIKLEDWLHGFDCVEDSVRHSCDMVKNHPLMPDDVPVHGLVINPETGELNLLVNGY